VGPPGVGKTSLAKSIAEAIGRNFVKVSLGGVRDEAEIRGHRKTYVASMPGRIIQAMKRAKVKNPLFLLDEIDKMSSDQRGDPASAMLEVLDPEQNAEFSDHYIEEAYDLSEVMFIATANYPENIPEALYDRMEIISLSSYTEIEKMSIARDYLVPKVLKEHALTTGEIEFTDEAIDELIKYYTREAGVRQLERLLSSISRKFIVKLLNKEVEHLVTNRKIVNEYLGKRLFEHTDKQEDSQVGVVTGLAYTQFGGDILPIEVNYFPGKGNLTLTGKLGDVMKESASIAYDYVRANYQKFGIKKEIFENNDVHIHVPEGAVPKDGPSAGVTITTAIVSALSGRPVSKDIGMTGEITLRGIVLPIGGLREKSISAARSGLKKILIPMKNIKDLDDVPDEVKAVLEIKGIERFEQTFEEVFGEAPSKPNNVVK
jgi:ATP-dependent Lon protease